MAKGTVWGGTFIAPVKSCPLSELNSTYSVPRLLYHWDCLLVITRAETRF